MISIQTTVDYSRYGTKAAQILSLLGPAARKDLHDGAATEVVELLKSHIGEYALSHHRTADDIEGGPATRTGHLEAAADSVAKESVTADSAEVTVSSPGFRRALGPLNIVPKNKPNLTVAIHALAYGKTVADLTFAGLRIFRIKKKSDGREFLAARDERKNLVVLYALKKEVTLKHAPDLLPSEDEFKQAVRSGVVGVVEFRLGNRGAA